MENVIFADPLSTYHAQKEEIDAAVLRVLSKGLYILGDEVRQFEEEFAAWCGTAHAVGLGNGTDAVQLALRCFGIGPGDLVATVSNTAVATVAAIELTGATPILIDVDAATFNMDIKGLEEAVLIHGTRLKAIIAVHLFGHPAAMVEILRIANAAGLVVIEDCAQAHGAKINGRRVGSWGHAAAFSFYPTKNLGAFGDGGALVTNDNDIAKQARKIRQYGWEQRYISLAPGMNTRLDEIQAAILRVKLRKLDEQNGKRREIAASYRQSMGNLQGIILPTEVEGCHHVYHQYTTRLQDRDRMLQYLTKEGIGTAVLYPQPIHQQAAYQDRLLLPPQGLPITERLATEILCLPVHPLLEHPQITRVSDAVVRGLSHPV